MVSVTSLELIGGVVTLPFYLAVLYLFFTRVRTRLERRGMFFTIGLFLIVFSYFAEFLADVKTLSFLSPQTLSVLSNAVFGLAGISMILSCYLSSKWLDEELTGGIV